MLIGSYIDLINYMVIYYQQYVTITKKEPGNQTVLANKLKMKPHPINQAKNKVMLSTLIVPLSRKIQMLASGQTHTLGRDPCMFLSAGTTLGE